MMREPPAFQEAKFLTSAAQFDQLPPDTGREVAFIGRSNAGKSSALNLITGIRGLARISKTPGRTQMINLFALNDPYRLVDLPGYGYAKVPKLIQLRWEKTIDEYLQNRQCLQGLILIMDIRHPLKEMDQHMLTWATASKVPTHVLLTKADKLNAAAARKTLKEVEDALQQFSEPVGLQLFSSLQRTGLDEVKVVLTDWFSKP